jgi:hypothetical protein
MSTIKIAGLVLVNMSLAFSAMAQSTYQLSGKINGIADEKIYLSNEDGLSDSTVAKNGTFSFTGKIT